MIDDISKKNLVRGLVSLMWYTESHGAYSVLFNDETETVYDSNEGSIGIEATSYDDIIEHFRNHIKELSVVDSLPREDIREVEDF